MASMNTRLNIEKLDGNIVQKHGGSKQVGFKQLGPSVETGVYGVHDEKRVWFEVKLQGAQGDREAEGFQVSNDDTAVAQRRLEDKQPDEKTNTDCLVKEHEKEYQTGWKIKTGIQQQNGLVNETNVTLFAKVHCFLIQSDLSKVFWADDTTMSTYLVNRSSSSAIGFKTPVDMLGFFGWLNSIKQGMLEPVKVKCIFLGYRKCIVGNKLWRLDDVTSKVLQGVEFEVEPQEDHTFEVEPQKNVDHVVGSQEVQTQDLIYYHSARDRKQHSTWELFSYREDSNEAAFAVAADGLKDDIDAQSDAYVLNNDCRKCSDDSDGYYWEYTPGMFIHLFLYIDDMVFSCGCKAEIWATKGLLGKAKGNALGMKIVRDQSGNTLRLSQSRFYNGKLVQTLLEGHFILLLEGSLSGDCDVEKNGKWSCIYAVGSQEYQMVYTRLDIASADVGMLDKFDCGLQTDVQVFVNFDYAMRRSITHMKALSTTEARYMTFTDAWKKEIWLKGLLTESNLFRTSNQVVGCRILQVRNNTIQQEQENKIIRRSHCEKQMRSSVDGLKEMAVNMTNITNKLTLKSNENLEKDIPGSINGQTSKANKLGEDQSATTENNNIEADTLVDKHRDFMMGWDNHHSYQLFRITICYV
ncbi:hypothetical protein Tco_1107344 [Tanacetum coccineum]